MSSERRHTPVKQLFSGAVDSTSDDDDMTTGPEDLDNPSTGTSSSGSSPDDSAGLDTDGDLTGPGGNSGTTLPMLGGAASGGENEIEFSDSETADDSDDASLGTDDESEEEFQTLPESTGTGTTSTGAGTSSSGAEPSSTGSGAGMEPSTGVGPDNADTSMNDADTTSEEGDPTGVSNIDTGSGDATQTDGGNMENENGDYAMIWQ